MIEKFMWPGFSRTFDTAFVSEPIPQFYFAHCNAVHTIHVCIYSPIHNPPPPPSSSIRPIMTPPPHSSFLEYRNVIIYPVLCILCNTFRNPSQISHFLFLQLDKAEKHRILKLLQKSLLVELDVVLEEFILQARSIFFFWETSAFFSPYLHLGLFWALGTPTCTRKLGSLVHMVLLNQYPSKHRRRLTGA